MQLNAYKNGLAALAVPKLNAFIKNNEDLALNIEGWGNLKATEKREALLEAFKENNVAREHFVAFYGEETGDDSDFSEWETEDLPDVVTGPASLADPQEPEAEPEAADLSPAEADAAAESSLEEDAAAFDAALAETSAGTGNSVAQHQATIFVDGAFEQLVSNVAGLNAEDSDANLKEMEDRLEFEHIRLGVLLSHIQKAQHYLTLGHDNMREYLAARTSLHYRKAMFLISNAETIQDLNLSATDLKGVSWSALRHITGVMNGENAKHWLDAARTLTHAALIEEVRMEKAKQAGALPPPKEGEEQKPVTQSKTFNFYPEQKANIEAAIEAAKAQGNVDSPAAALDLIAASFTGKPPTDATVASVLPDLSDTGLTNALTKVKADEGVDGAVRLLNLIATVWPEVDINVSLPPATAAE